MKKIIFLLVFASFFISIVSAAPPTVSLPNLPPDIPMRDPFDDRGKTLDRTTSTVLYDEDDPSTYTNCPANISQGQSADPFTDPSINGSMYECKVVGDFTLVKGTYKFNGMIMFADNSVLDCNGATLLGPSNWPGAGGSSVRVYGKNNTIKNCNSLYWFYGIVVGRYPLFDTNDNKVFNNTIRNTSVGIFIRGNNNEIMNNNIVGTGIGIKSSEEGLGGPDLVYFYINNNYIHDNFIDRTVLEAVKIYGMANTLIFNNTITNSQSGMGIRMYGNENVTINNNNISGNFDSAVGGKMGRNVNISYNTMKNDGVSSACAAVIAGNGIFFETPIIHNNIITDSPRIAIKLEYPDGAKIFNNEIARNSYGIYIPTSFPKRPPIEITNNNISNNNGVGIAIDYASDVTIAHNTINWNGDSGVFFANWHHLQDTDNYVYNNTMVGNFNHGFVTDMRFDSVLDPGNGVRNHVYDNIFSGSSIGCGVFLRERISNNDIYNNEITNNFIGVCFEFNNGTNNIRENTITGNNYGTHSLESANNNIYLNSIYSNHVYNTESDRSTEVSYGGIGNYWGRSLPGPCFIPGLDSSRNDMNDSYAYCDGAPSSNVNIKIPTFGWYLFGSNIIPLNPDVENVLNPISGYYDLIQSSVNGDQRQYNPIAPFGNDLNVISPQNGYWMKVTATPPSDFIIVGDEVNPSSCYRLSLTPTPSPTSWIGYWASGTQPIATALSSIDGSYSLVRTYDNGGWTTYDPALPMFSDLDFMKPGQGYIITITNSDDLDYLGGFCPP